MRHLLSALAVFLALTASARVAAQPAPPSPLPPQPTQPAPAAPPARPRPPVIDVHVHSTRITPQQELERMSALNIRYVVVTSLGPDLPAWAAALPADRYHASLALPCEGGVALEVKRPCWAGKNTLPPVGWVRAELKAGRLKGLGEITAAHIGLSPADKSLEPYWALAEEFDVPIAFHMGQGPQNAAYEGNPSGSVFPKYRQVLTSPDLLEETLLRHKRARVLLMHAGWPYQDTTLSILWGHPNVYVDIAGLQGGPRAIYYRYLRALIDSGFGKRILFGSDSPNLAGPAIDALVNADFITAEEKADILCENARRFYRLNEAVCR